jgi:hypothetical protein
MLPESFLMFSDRDKALADAIKGAAHNRAVWVIFKHEGMWNSGPYPIPHVVKGDAEDIRYILPTGEVTKLS